MIFGCRGTTLDDDEKAFFAEADPLGFILFGRNVENARQLRALVQELRDVVTRPDAPVLIDQEGGRVARLGPPEWREVPAAATIGRLAETDQEAGEEAAWLNARLIARDLRHLGVTVDCAPVVDVPAADGHPVIGDRAFSADPNVVKALGRAASLGLLAGGVTPVVKHIPGHGRATTDSHEALPVVDTDYDTLWETDFLPFRALAHMPWAMTAHVVFSALDRENPATLSRDVIHGVVRDTIGYDGVLVTDDLSMEALSGSLADRAEGALKAGCDVVLHGSGDMDGMEAVAGVVPQVRKSSLRRLMAAEDRRQNLPVPLIDDARMRLSMLLEEVA